MFYQDLVSYFVRSQQVFAMILKDLKEFRTKMILGESYSSCLGYI